MGKRNSGEKQMSIPVIVKNSKIPNLLSWVIDVYAITLWPFVFIRDDGNERTINHETIHIKQYNELFVVGFLIKSLKSELVFINFNKAAVCSSTSKRTLFSDANSNKA